MKPFSRVLFVCLLCATLQVSSSKRILVVGSTSSFHSSVSAFDPTEIVDQLKELLAEEGGNHQVTFKNTFVSFPAFRHSLVQYFFWPKDGLKEVLKSQKWDHVVCIEDPYINTEMPGVHAEGVHHIAKFLGDSSKVSAFVQWPKGSGNSKRLAEIAYRIAQGSGVNVIPAGLAWDTLPKKATDVNHPSSEGALLAAASIFSQIFNKKAPGSESRTKQIADHAFKIAQNQDSSEFTQGSFSIKYPFSMQNNKERNLTSIHYGTSTETRILNAFDKIVDSNGMLHKNYKFCRLGEGRCRGQNFETPPREILPLDFNIGRANGETFKRFLVSPQTNDVAYGFAFQDMNPGAWLYTIDRYSSRNGQTTDLDVALSAILNGRRALTIPLRLLYAKLSLEGSFEPLHEDGRHLSDFLNEAAGSYLFTTLTGRCQIGSKPSGSGTSFKKWVARRVGYETAWRLNFFSQRVPGLEMKSKKSSMTEVKTFENHEIEVRFRFPPTANVVVKASSPDKTFEITSGDLVFTPARFDKVQSIKFKVLGTKKKRGTLKLVTSSGDPVFSGIEDSIDYEIKQGSASSDKGGSGSSTPFPSTFPTAFPTDGKKAGPTPFPSVFPTPFPKPN